MEAKPKVAKRTIGEKILDIIFPVGLTCLICGNDVKSDNIYKVCNECLAGLPLNNNKICLRCGTKLEGEAKYCLICKNRKKTFEKAVSPFLFEGELIKIVHDFKYNNALWLFSPLAQIMAEWFEKYNLYADYIIPVPLHENKVKERGYNQAEELSKHIACKLNIPVLTNTAFRIKDTSSQTYLTAKERKNNLKNAFKIENPKCLKTKNILLVDDVFTTGATVCELSSALLKKGAGKIFVLTLCHTDLRAKKTGKSAIRKN